MRSATTVLAAVITFWPSASPAWGQSVQEGHRSAAPRPYVRLTKPTRTLPDPPGDSIKVAKAAGTTFIANGGDADWNSCPPCGVNVFTTSTSVDAHITEGHFAIKHGVEIVGNDTLNADTLFLWAKIVDSDNDPGDNLVVFLDADHRHTATGGHVEATFGLGDGGIRFRRDGTVQRILGEPFNPIPDPNSTGAPPASSCGTGDICILDTGTSGCNCWIVEAKLVPSYFSVDLKALAGMVGMMVVVQDDNPSVPPGITFWPSGALSADITTWKSLDLGRPVDVVLVLDMSGSMNTLEGGSTRIDLLQQAVEIFTNLLAAAAVPADRIAVRYFNNKIDSFPTDGSLLGNLQGSAATTVSTNVNAKQAGAFTGMGGGLRKAYDALQDAPDHARHIVLFTDGIQNANPMVMNTVGSPSCDAADPVIPSLNIGNDGSIILGTGVPPLSTLLSQWGIDIHAIGLVSTTTGPNAECLNRIGTIAGNNVKLTTNLNDLTQHFVEEVVDVLRGQSPQLIAYRRGRTQSETVEKFESNSTSQKIILKLSWKPGNSLRFRVFKDSVDVTALGDTIGGGQGSFYQIFSLPLPVATDTGVVTAGGTWEMHITGPVGTYYEAAALSDEYALNYKVGFAGESHKLGQPLRVVADLSVGGQPVTDATVSTTILKPKLSIGALLSTNPTPPSKPIEQATTAANDKLRVLLQDSTLLESIQSSPHQIELTSNGDGTYEGSFLQTDVAGAYTAVFHISGSHDLIGSYHRQESVSTYVSFANADFQLSGVGAKVVKTLPDGMRRVRFQARPRNATDFLGPDYGHRIQITVAGTPIDPAAIHDRLDGSYDAEFTVADDPEIRIAVLGEPLYVGPLSEILPRPRFELLVGSGAAIPTGSFRTTFDPGFNAVVGLGYLVDPSLLVGVHVGYNHFRSTVSGVDDFELINVSANATYTLGSGAVSPFLRGGPGIYVPARNGGRTRFGANGGVGLQLGLGGVAFEVGTDYHEVFGASTDFAHAHAGLVFRF